MLPYPILRRMSSPGKVALYCAAPCCGCAGKRPRRTGQQEKAWRERSHQRRALPGGRENAVARKLKPVLTGAVTTVAALGDLTRFEHPRQLMSYLGLTPSVYSSGARRRQGGFTKTGNAHARWALVEGAWAYRYPATISCPLQRRLKKFPKRLQVLSGQA